MFLKFTENKWNNYLASELTLAEILHKDDKEYLEKLDVDFIKKNRVTVAQFAQEGAIANTPHSPRSNSTISQQNNNDNTSGKESHQDRDTEYMAAVVERCTIFGG